MKKEIIIKDENQNDVVVSVIGEFKIDELQKEFIMYSVVDNDSADGLVLVGEVLRDDDGNIQVLGIKEDELDLVKAFYNEISNQLGKED